MAKSKKDLKPWERTAAIQAAPIDFLPPRQSFLIICEGQETEKNYFNSFRANKSVEDFEVKGLGANTLSLVQKALEIRANLEAKREAPFDQAWCVFDRDSFPAQNFNAALQLATQNGFHVAYSNQAFELWYLLHFDFHNAAISRTLYSEKLSAKLGFHYRKNSPLTYTALQQLGDEERAMKFADNLLKSCITEKGFLDPESNNPSTTIHCLVRELRDQGPQPQRKNALCQEIHEILKSIGGSKK